MAGIGVVVGLINQRLEQLGITSGGTFPGAVDELILDAANQDVFLNRQAAGVLGVGTAAGNALGTLQAAVLLVADGSAAAPSVHGVDADTGIAFGSNVLFLSTGGAAKIQISSTSTLILQATRHRDNIVAAFGTADDAQMVWDLGQTNDAWQWSPGDVSNTILIVDNTHLAVDMGHANQSDPTIFLHANSATTTLWLSMAHDGTDGVLTTGAGDLSLAPASGIIATTGVILAPDGTTGAPAYSFSGDTDSGLIRVGASIALVASANSILTLSTTVALFNSVVPVNAGILNTSKGYQSTATTIVATSDGLTTGLIPSKTSVATTTVATDADDIVTLPVPIIGMQIRVYVGGTGHEVRTVAASGVTINNVDSDGTNELALAANTYVTFECVSATAWIARGFDNVGADLAALVPDAA